MKISTIHGSISFSLLFYVLCNSPTPAKGEGSSFVGITCQICIGAVCLSSQLWFMCDLLLLLQILFMPQILGGLWCLLLCNNICPGPVLHRLKIYVKIRLRVIPMVLIFPYTSCQFFFHLFFTLALKQKFYRDWQFMFEIDWLF